QVLIYKQDVICQTNYQLDRKVKFKVTWQDKTRKKYKVTSTKSSSNATKQFI
ncbi:2573_t:CDS:1, partial [Scutellospora calospora]